MQLYAQTGLLKEGEDVKINQLSSQVELMTNKLNDTKEKANDLKDEINDSLNQKSILKLSLIHI